MVTSFVFPLLCIYTFSYTYICLCHKFEIFKRKNEPNTNSRRLTSNTIEKEDKLINSTYEKSQLLQLGYEELVDIYGDSVYRFCRSLTYNESDAEDLFQETFIKAYEQFSKIQLSENPQGVLFSIAAYTFKSWKRKFARRQKIAPMQPMDNSELHDSCNLEDDYIKKESLIAVQIAVNGLPDKFKIPIVLHYTFERKVSEIAQILNVSQGTIKSRLFKARKLIEQKLEAEI